MRYWVYIDEKVAGPYEEADLATLPVFTQETLICSEDSASSGTQEWQKASSVFEFDEVPVEDAGVTLPSIDQVGPVNVAPAAAAAASSLDTAALLQKLDLITN